MADDTEMLTEIIAEFDDLNLTSVTGGKLELSAPEPSSSSQKNNPDEKPTKSQAVGKSPQIKAKQSQKPDSEPAKSRERKNEPPETIKQKSNGEASPTMKTYPAANGGLMGAKQKQRRGKGRRREDKKAPEFSDDEDPENGEMDDGEGVTLGPRKAGGKKLKFSKSPKLLVLYGIISILLGFAIAGCGVAAFLILPEFVSRNSFQVEWKWTNMILIFSGISAIMMTRKQTLTSITSTLVCSLLGACMGLATSIVHIVNCTFRGKDEEYYKEVGDYKMRDITIRIGTLNVFLVVFGFLSSVTSILLYRHALHIAGKSFGYLSHIERQRLRLSGFGMAHVVLGLLISAWWIAIETLFQGSGLDFRALPTSEVLAHGLVVVCTGYIQMMATSKGIQPLLLASAVFNGASFFLVTFFSARPLSLVYLIFDMGASTTGSSFDIRFGLAGFLCLFYILEMMFAIYSLIRFLHFTAGDKISRIDNMLEKYHRLFCITSVSQIILGLLYAILEVITVGLQYAYKTDFSPLPLFIISCGLFGFGSLKMGSTLLITVTITVAGYCSAVSIRDIYLFMLHATHGQLQADSSYSPKFMTGSSLAFHFAIGVIALIEVVLAVIMVTVYAKTLLGSLTCLYNRIEHRRGLLISKIISIISMVSSIAIVLLGLVLFVMKTEHIEVLGDYAITLGVFLVISASFSVASVFGRKKTILLLPALMTNLICFIQIWQESDEFAYLVHYHLGWRDEFAVTTPQPALSPGSTSTTNRYRNDNYAINRMTSKYQDGDEVGFRLGITTLILIAFQWVLSGVWCLIQGGILETAQFQKLEMNSSRVEELVSMRGKTQSQTVESELDLVDQNALNSQVEENIVKKNGHKKQSSPILSDETS